MRLQYVAQLLKEKISTQLVIHRDNYICQIGLLLQMTFVTSSIKHIHSLYFQNWINTFDLK
jgi:hypothetical protein